MLIPFSGLTPVAQLSPTAIPPWLRLRHHVPNRNQRATPLFTPAGSGRRGSRANRAAERSRWRCGVQCLRQAQRRGTGRAHEADRDETRRDGRTRESDGRVIKFISQWVGETPFRGESPD